MKIEIEYEGKPFEFDTETKIILAEEKLLQSIMQDSKKGCNFLREIRKKMPEAKKLNVGCGFRPFMDYINLDWDSEVSPDVVRDVKEGLPFDTDKFEEVYSSHVIEHVQDVFFFMFEIWRVCKDKAKVTIIAPYWGFLDWAIQPDHLRLINYTFFNRWVPGWQSVQNEDKQCRGAKFNLIKTELINETKEIRFDLECVKNG